MGLKRQREARAVVTAVAEVALSVVGECGWAVDSMGMRLALCVVWYEM